MDKNRTCPIRDKHFFFTRASAFSFRAELIAASLAAVGEFRELCMWADKDRALCETLKKVLKLTKGWDAAKEHAMQAVTSDHLLRIWSQEPNSGLIFKTLMGVVDIEKPCGAGLSLFLLNAQAQLEGHFAVLQRPRASMCQSHDV